MDSLSGIQAQQDPQTQQLPCRLLLSNQKLVVQLLIQIQQKSSKNYLNLKK